MAASQGRRLRILLVEDDALVAKFVRVALTSYEVDVTHSGETAVELCRAKGYDLLILDLMLSGLMDGIDVFQEVRRLKGTPPRAILVSAATEAPALARGLGLPIIIKPFNAAELREAVARALGQSTANPTAPGSQPRSSSAHRS